MIKTAVSKRVGFGVIDSLGFVDNRKFDSDSDGVRDRVLQFNQRLAGWESGSYGILEEIFPLAWLKADIFAFPNEARASVEM
jgi:hypothetical protein